ncbi:hypothetical protein [aff. Roholtiella sp. LEGE 12411]|uniref:hypothetical protein n=1 Tax=aff. Roholtiella sp. LEGE 12411 TaxID=1828822 RepID=UPI00187F36BA|nr:hypothetical protein [aff. Roholtiella sp. LEGE 12411]MBE9036570.1 hypothetical protein [aff. Roholtiella sp. LEGE 12411]
MPTTKKNPLFTEVTVEESAVVSGGNSGKPLAIVSTDFLSVIIKYVDGAQESVTLNVSDSSPSIPPIKSGYPNLGLAL